VHEEELNVLGVVDEESLVAGGHHVLGLLVGSITDLFGRISMRVSCRFSSRMFDVRFEN